MSGVVENLELAIPSWGLRDHFNGHHFERQNGGMSRVFVVNSHGIGWVAGPDGTLVFSHSILELSICSADVKAATLIRVCRLQKIKIWCLNVLKKRVHRILLVSKKYPQRYLFWQYLHSGYIFHICSFLVALGNIFFFHWDCEVTS